MNTEDYLAFNRELGHKIIVTDSCAWIYYGTEYVHSFPQLDNVHPNHNDFSQVFQQNVNLLLFKTDTGFFNTQEYIFSGDSYDLALFDSKIRNQIRKGMKSCIVRDADFDTLSKRGLEINVSTLVRHKRSVEYLDNKDRWETYISKFLNRRDVYVKGAYVDDNLIGYIIFLQVKGKYIILHPFMDHSFSSLNPMNAILFTFINETISKEGSIEVSYGLASYTEKSGLDKFKRGMLFTSRPATRIVVMRPPLMWLLNGATRYCLSFLAKTKLIRMDLIEKVNYLVASKDDYKKYLRYIKNCK